jgi:hypothetical protein
MQKSDDQTPAGPRPGVSAEAFRQALRDASALLDDDIERPRSFFLGMRYENGTDYVHAHAAAGPAGLDEKVYHLFSPLAVHVQQVAEAANADPETVVECALEVLGEMDDPATRDR